MQVALIIAALLVVCVSIAHSYLGERYILMRLFRRDELPKLLGGTTFTRRTMRFAWHLTSVAWLGLGGVLLLLSQRELNRKSVATVIGLTFGIHFVTVLVASRGRHLAWPVFLAITVLAFFAGWGT
jgi:hypothetical protein